MRLHGGPGAEAGRARGRRGAHHPRGRVHDPAQAHGRVGLRAPHPEVPPGAHRQHDGPSLLLRPGGPRSGGRVIFHDYYSDIPRDEVDRFVQSQELSRLITVGDDSVPRVGLYPFIYDGKHVDLHLVRSDEQIEDLKARPRCVLEVDEVLAVIPSYWVHAEYAGSATAYHRTVIFECEARVEEDPAAVAAQQRRLLARYQPEGGFRPLDPGDPLYRGAMAQLAAVRLEIIRWRAKFKLGQNRPAQARRRGIAQLRKRGRPNDGRAAHAPQGTIDAEGGRHGNG